MKPAWFRAAALLAVLLPCAAPAFEWSGRAGAIYARDDAWAPATGGTSLPRLDLDLALDANGYVYTPDVLTWSGGGAYRRYTANPSTGPSTERNQLTYQLRTTAFGRRGSPFTLAGYASRSEGDGTANVGSYGSREQTYGGTAQVSLWNRPNLMLGYAHSDGRYTSPTVPTHESARDNFDVATAYATPVFGYDLRYRANLSTGTYDAENFDDHRLDVTSRVSSFKSVALQITDNFYRRTPTRSSDYNPRQEMNSFAVLGRHEASPVSTEQVRYSHASGLSETSASLYTRTADVLDVDIRRPLAEKEWSLATTLSANYLDAAVQGPPAVGVSEHQRTAGQSVTAITHWDRQMDGARAQVHAGPTLGIVEAFDGEAKTGWGASAGAAFQRQFTRLLAGAQYSIGYSSSAGTPGTSLTQSATVDAEGGVGAGRLRGLVTASAERSNTPLTGYTASRSLIGTLDYGARSYGAFFGVQVRDGVALPLRDPIRGDGLFLSPGYDARSTSVSGGLRGGVGGLTATGSVRLTNVVMPDRPTQDDLEARAELGYRLGAFGMGFEERYLVSLRDRTRLNVVMFRVYRLFGSRY